MGHLFATIYLLLAATFFVGTGVYGLVLPRHLAASLDLAPARSGGVCEVRAQYGGFFLALGLACATAAFGGLERRVGLLLAAITFGGLILGRAAGVIIDRSTVGYGPTVRGLFLVDAAGVFLAMAATLGDAP